MSNHPLTDEIILRQFGSYQPKIAYTDDDLRHAYDLGARKGHNEQLDKVLVWLNKNLRNYTDDDFLIANRYDCTSIHEIKEDLRKAMRPTAQEEES